MEIKDPGLYYQERILSLTNVSAGLRKRHALLGWARLLAIVLLAVAAYTLWFRGWYFAIVALATISVFFYLVYLALETEEKLSNTNRLIKINQEELLVLDGRYSHRANGDEFISIFHLPDNDLDLFGPASLFQYYNRANSYHGKLALATAFTATPKIEEIEKKQQAVKELCQDPGWCQQLQSYTMIAPVSKETETLITEWLQDDKETFEKPIWRLLSILVPVISFTTLGLYLADKITDALFNTIMLLMLAFVFSFYKKITREYSHLSKVIQQLHAFLPTLQWIENAGFENVLFKEKQTHLLHHGKASSAIAGLKGILKRFDYRLNPLVYLPLSAFLFWDLQQALALQKWKKKQTANLAKWFEVTGDVEMLASIAITAFNRPTWIFPEITSRWFELECRELGHPLIRESKVVTSDFSLHGTPQFALITGSNMAGKSTFLRSVGANMVLAMAGSPVRAAYMKLPVAKILSSMRIADNLEEETSTFYAELKKIKRIVESANAGDKIFILIDEMLRGTNTLDRHTGSVALIKQLLRQGAVGIIASHDIALASLEQEYPGQLSNYHFDSTIINEEIVFDYKIKDGVCKSTNASLLMKKIGIEIEN
ncbi:MAG: hypothetical protein V4717_22130 [Bacteroidota bacterium]